ncbi:hypothetical protein [Burkholderia oklahomensis]|uniref:Uncharacterized protein n=1 Tax=Burkholderia oklahomensis TaxID=342113 RepID=A0AAI8B5I3_9BURK|nr:hypothetical protein [Burkholderia oklahomensis]AIO65864.1 hypothetical protein DM82_2226 [Burkholderia oklahomensis]AOI41606.1 hypothetical protein WG70_18130 [Burkholderia oklahomensis EO147]KUY69204.1 hypothetical protein WG70_23260 [Burkholderia oklahomensis EO147]QPS36347.1 hypothetical protein I6G57_13465 [Burkholderia oklahomensis]
MLVSTAALSIALLAAAPLRTEAKQTNRSLSVGASVQPYVRITVTNPSRLVITNKDSNQGFTSVPDKDNSSGTQLAVQTNDRAGYALLVRVSPVGQSLFSSIAISGFGKTVVLPATGGIITVPYTAINTNFTLTYRFMLAKTAKDGTYAWPLTFTAQPIP